jgi:hypothetical protein
VDITANLNLIDSRQAGLAVNGRELFNVLDAVVADTNVPHDALLLRLL